MNLTNLKSLFVSKGCKKVYTKILSPNDNSKNQVYFGGSFEILNILPLQEIVTEEAGDWKKERFKAKINFSWVNDQGSIFPAPKAQLILYPKYPEVRFSGFLAGCQNAPSELMTQRLEGRLLLFSVDRTGEILGYVAAPDSEIAIEFDQLQVDSVHGVFSTIDLPMAKNNRAVLLDELKRIHQLGWISSKRLNNQGGIMDCQAPNCGGYTLEAELGITPNGYSEPDFMGWEVKQFGVSNFNSIKSKVITLMTPEPTDGLYKTEGSEYFVRTYGYKDKKGRPDRLNFGGIHRIGEKHHLTNLTMKLIGFDTDSGKIRNSNGRIVLLDESDNETASWSFASLLKHWNRKHNQACYVPSLSEINPERKYRYGSEIILGTGTDFQLFLLQMANGNIYYDPGIKLENISTKPKIKKRSQFRIKSGFLPNLYKNNEIVDIIG
ncbi:hypothetical protein I215_09376 [Galbibacter marinus]|uniref:MvaI/BcnI restriction endonuclease domain-containing protein n=1 Tax=Galbibacter marinus TaxID=555500 RepID=K2QK16_9FLAO|nr:MvaI/BcnI family restriction endonuclease [Galbibacter marinus]EKF55062.1 hypothetical protein I215_09376 [Galbibacter marinus]